MLVPDCSLKMVNIANYRLNKTNKNCDKTALSLVLKGYVIIKMFTDNVVTDNTFKTRFLCPKRKAEIEKKFME